MCVCVCECVCVRMCVYACVRMYVCVRACVCVHCNMRGMRKASKGGLAAVHGYITGKKYVFCRAVDEFQKFELTDYMVCNGFTVEA